MKQEAQQPKVSWVSMEYQRPPWLRVRYGARVKPPNQQSSNLDLSDGQVLQPRDEPVGYGVAFPIR